MSNNGGCIAGTGVAEVVKVESCGIVKPLAGQQRSTLIVGLGHEARNGKGIVSRHVLKVFSSDNLVIRQYAFADDLKIELFDWIAFLRFAYPSLAVLANVPNGQAIAKTPEDKIHWCDLHKKVLRPLTQLYGDFRRDQDRNYVINRVRERIANDIPHVAVINDIRLPEEASMCDITIRIKRNGFKVDGKVAVHKTERALDTYPYDYILTAKDGDLVTLKLNAEKLFREILGKRGLLNLT